MAGYNQHPRYANPSPAPGANGRGGNQTGGRGQGKRGNGRYNNKNNWGPQPNGMYGPYPVPDMSAPTAFLQDQPVPWEMQFGGYPMPMPHVEDTGPWIPPPPGLGYPNNAAAMMNPRGPSGYLDARSHLDTSSMSTPVYTPPIASPLSHITTTAAEMNASPAANKICLALDPSKNDPNATWTGTADTSKRAVSYPTDRTNGEAQAATVDLTVNKTRACGSSYASPNSPERRTFAMDANHGTLDQTADQLDVERLVNLQVYNISLASKLRQALQEAKSDHQVRENKIRAMQTTAKFELNLALNAESTAVATSSKLRDDFYHDMTEACKLDGDTKPAAQLRATEHLKLLTEWSHRAANERNVIDKYRNELQDLDNARARSRNTYSNTIFDALMKALGAEAPEPSATSRKDDAATSATPAKTLTVAKDEAATVEPPSNISKPKEERQDSAAVAVPVDSKESTQQPDQSKEQPVFERRPEPEHSSIREILEAVNVVEKPFEDGNLVDKPLDDVNLVDKPFENVQPVQKQKGKSQKGKEKQAAVPDAKVPSISFTTKGTPAPKSAGPTASETGKSSTHYTRRNNNTKRTAAEPRDKAKDKVSSLPPHTDSDSDLAHLSSASTPQTSDQPPRLKQKKYFKKKKKAATVGGDGVGMANAAPKTGPAGNGGNTNGAAKAGSVGSVRASKAGPAAGEVRKGG
jgi:hypothetical protein